MIGILYGVGVGPGDAELITIKAVKTILICDIIAIPKSGDGERVALNIAMHAVPEIADKKIMELNMPMTRDKNLLLSSHQKAAEEIIAYLEQGKNIAFLTLGDPSIYSTYFYVHEIIKAKGYEAQVIPGVTSFCAVAAKLGESLTQASQPLHIIPASYPNIEKNIDLKGTKILMKTGKSLFEVKKLLNQKNLIGYTKMIQNCGMENEKIFQNIQETNDEDYFSIIVIKDKE